MAAIYGANGAGKSNLLKGINFLKAFATNKDFLDKQKVTKFFFALKENAGSEPIELAIEFVAKTGEPFIYALKINSTGILYEALHRSGLGNTDNTIVFTRQNSEVQYASAPSAELGAMVVKWLENNPFASLLTLNSDMPVLSDERIEIARKWFSEELVIIGIHSFTPILIDLLKNNDKIRRFATHLFETIGLGINELLIDTQDFDEWVANHEIGTLPVDKLSSVRTGVLSEVVDFRNTKAISIENGVRKISQILFRQFGENGFLKEMDIQAQSDGTVRLLSLVPAFFDAIYGAKTVVIDELDHSIHPHLVRQLVRYYSSQKSNGQLIFTTHQTCLLNQDFIRTDEVWLAEKQYGCSHLYTLNDFKIHNTINIENGYLEGRYGAIPYIGELNF